MCDTTGTGMLNFDTWRVGIVSSVFLTALNQGKVKSLPTDEESKWIPVSVLTWRKDSNPQHQREPNPCSAAFRKAWKFLLLPSREIWYDIPIKGSVQLIWTTVEKPSSYSKWPLVESGWQAIKKS